MLDRSSAEQPESGERENLLVSMLRHWWLVIPIIAAFIGLGALLSASQTEEYTATSGLIVEDPRASSLFVVTDIGRPSTQSSERFLADQVEILRSTEVANIASEFLSGDPSPTGVLRRRDIVGDLTSNLIEVEFTAGTPAAAQAGADAVANAYQEVRRRQVQATATVALAKVDALLASIDTDLDEISTQIEALEGGDAQIQELNRQFQEAQEDLNSLRRNRELLPIDSEERAAINARIDELLRDFSTWEVVLRISQTGSELASLIAEQSAAVAEQATLIARANSIEVDAELAAGGVALFSPAPLPDEPSGTPSEQVLVLAAILGIVLAAVASYYLTLRRNVAAGRRSPRALLDAPLLAEIPKFDLKGIDGSTPVISAPRSESAEAFRFAASVVDIRAAAVDARTLFVVSATTGSGRTAAVANTGLAAAADGLRILLIDADFAKQDLTYLMLRKTPRAGLTDVIDGKADLEDAVTKITVGKDHSVALLSKGGQRVEATNYVRAEKTQSFFRSLRDKYDLVLVDGPPLLQVAYASALARYSDAVIAVVEHGSDIAEIQELHDHLALIDVPILGYIYTKSPAGHAMPDSEAISSAVARPVSAQDMTPIDSPSYTKQSAPPKTTVGLATPWPTKETAPPEAD